jgi:hypothetical protein
VSVRISPRLDWDEANIAYTPDYLMELYHYDGKQLKYLEAIEPADAKPALFGD